MLSMPEGCRNSVGAFPVGDDLGRRDGKAGASNDLACDCARGSVLLSLCYFLVRGILRLAVWHWGSNDVKGPEIAVLHHELAILRRRTKRSPLTMFQPAVLSGCKPPPAAQGLAMLHHHARDAQCRITAPTVKGALIQAVPAENSIPRPLIIHGRNCAVRSTVPRQQGVLYSHGLLRILTGPFGFMRVEDEHRSIRGPSAWGGSVTTPRDGRSDGGGRRPLDWPRPGPAWLERSAAARASLWPGRDAFAHGGRTPGNESRCEIIGFIHDHHVIKTLALDGADEPLHIPVLPTVNEARCRAHGCPCHSQ